MAEGIKALTANTANAFGGTQLSLGLQDILKPKKVDTRSAKEIKEYMKNIIRKAGDDE